MASAFRFMGVELKPTQAVGVALTKIYGIGPWQAQTVCAKLGLNPDSKLQHLESSLPIVRNYIERVYPTKAQAERVLGDRINFKIKIQCFEGQRHQYALPLNGQKVKTNAKTQKKLGMSRAGTLGFVLVKPKQKGGQFVRKD